ncbi:MAG: MotA/TolQ/ExbB proton channel family protein [Patescibacteria group bacterium]|nr:MotA/TolQ/ExbB proton channel family protein [Patescibacteria group bacterium]
MSYPLRVVAGRTRGLALLLVVSGMLASLAVAQAPPASSPDETIVRIGDPPAGAPAASDPLPMPAEAEPAIPTRNLWEIILWGGPLMIPIALCSLMLVAVALERAISLRRSRVIPKPFTKRFLQQLRDGELDRERALELCRENGSPVAEVFAAAARKWGRASVEVEQAIIDAGERATNGLRRYLRVLNGIATVAPLLGLLGTVVGMIRAFNDIGHAEVGERAQTVAIGISQALLTTAGGLSVAIPALICYLFFVSRVDRLIIDIDAMGQEVVAVIAAEETGGRKTSTPSTSRRSTPRDATA